MSLKIEETGLLKINSNTVIFNEGEKIENLLVITKGDIDVYISSKDLINTENKEDIIQNSCKLFSIPRNIIIGIGGYRENSNYMFSLKSNSENEVYIIKTSNKEEIKNFFNKNKPYLTNMYHSTSYLSLKFYEEYIKIKNINNELKTIFTNSGIAYFNINSKNKHLKSESFLKIKEIFESATKSGFYIPHSFDVDFVKSNHKELSDYNKDLSKEENDNKLNVEMEYIRRFLTMPKNIKDSFFTYDTNMSLSAANMLYNNLVDIINLLKKEFAETIENIFFIYSPEKESLFYEYSKIAFEFEKEGKDNEVLAKYTEYLGNITKRFYNLIKEEYELDLNINEEEIDSIIKKLLKKSDNAESEIENANKVKVIIGAEQIPEEIKNPAKRIIEISGIEEERAKTLLKGLDAFRKLKDKFDTEDEARKIRRSVTNVFFEVFKEIAKKLIIDGKDSKLLKMFLNYGYMDDGLLTPNQIMDLYEVEDKTKAKNFNVFYIDEWLKKIYDKEELPSVNGFGQDYKEALREMKKRGIISDKEAEEHFESQSKRLEYEIENMVATTQRLCYGQVSVYFPIIHSDMVIKDFKDALIKRATIESVIESIKKVDFSAFYREVLYKNSQLNITKELVMKEVLPNIILMPTFGSRAIMWEELSSRQKDSTGRFLFPIFTSEDLESLAIPTIGAFRWELCKTMLGPAWNDITQMSLTSSYSDYIQFYKKNRDLSDDSKEKIKIQIKKCRNNLREVFVSDYFIWIKYESKGIMRLNRVNRNILFREVPLSKNIRDELEKQPMFSDIANRFRNIRMKKATELENRYFKFTKTGNPLPEELANHINFYKSM